MMYPTLALLNGTNEDHHIVSGYPGRIIPVRSRSSIRPLMHLTALSTVPDPLILLEYGHDPCFDWERTTAAIEAMRRIKRAPDLLLLNGADRYIRATLPVDAADPVWRQIAHDELDAHWGDVTAYCILTADRRRSLLTELGRKPSLVDALIAASDQSKTFGAILPLFERLQISSGV